jgi:hypothetical protein
MVHFLDLDMPRFPHKTIDEFIGFILAIFLISIAILGARASTITGVNDTMSRGKVGTAANHAISFVTPSGASEGQTMTVTFPPAFGASGMTENDVDLFDDGLAVTTAPDCAGVEQAAVAWTGNTLSFQICPGDGGAFAPGSTVMIAIGTNAVDSGVGVNRIMNPSVPGSYRITIGGSFSDSGVAAVTISVDDSVGVTACVGDVCNVAPPPPPLPPIVSTEPIVGASTGPNQTPPPQISNLLIDEITASTARVSWHTDIMSDSHVLLGLTTDYGAVRGDSVRTQDHSVLLMGLASGLTYHLEARSMGYFGDIGVSKDMAFSTLSIKTIFLPQITDILLESVSGYDAEISWKTDVPTYWEIDFGRTANYGNEVNDADFDILHEATLGNLSAATTYHFRIVAIDANGNRAESDDQIFTTFDSVPPVILMPHVENIAPHSADIVWQTNKPATGGVSYGASAAYESGDVLETDGFATAHRVALVGLLSGTSYHYEIEQTDKMNNDAESNDMVFSTTVSAESPEAPGKIITPPKNAVAFGSGALPLTVNGVQAGIVGNGLTAAPGSLVGVALPPELTEKPVANITVGVGEQAYRTNGTDTTYFQTPLAPGETPVTVTVNYTDGSSAYSQWNLKIAVAGSVYEQLNGKQVPIAGSLVTVLENGEPWDGAKYGQNNTQTTDVRGGFSFFLPKGNYSLKIEKNGYKTQITGVRQYDGPVSDSIKMAKISQNPTNSQTYWILLLILIILSLLEISHDLSQKNSKKRLHT